MGLLDQTISDYKRLMDRNTDSSKALADKGMFELATACYKDNQLIAMFINDLEAIKHDSEVNRGPG